MSATTRKTVISEEQRRKLIASANEAKTHSYSPYSKFRVGAALLTSDGTVFQGANVENASYGGAICAERSAVVSAVSNGYTKFVAIAVAGDCPQPISPCGICRQFIREFGTHIVIYLTRPDGTYVEKTLEEILPLSFGPEDLS